MKMFRQPKRIKQLNNKWTLNNVDIYRNAYILKDDIESQIAYYFYLYQLNSIVPFIPNKLRGKTFLLLSESRNILDSLYTFYISPARFKSFKLIKLQLILFHSQGIII